MLKAISKPFRSVARRLYDQLEKYSAQSAVNEYRDSRWEWKWELGERSGYLFWKCFDPVGSHDLPIYRRLPSSRHTRVLQVECTATGPKKQFLANLVPVSVDSPETPYIAISYTWGDPAVFAEIDFKYERRIGITKSVYTLLDNLLEKGQRLRLWIDAICINQKDVDEKEQQVGMMTDIYRSAMHVVISLGEANAETDEAMDCIHHLSNAVDEEYHALENIGTGKGSVQGSVKPLGLDSWEKIEVLLYRPWFERIWVVQEASVGSKVPLFVCGKRAVDWDTFCHAVDGYMALHSAFRKDLYRADSSASPVGLLNLTVMNAVRKSIQSEDTNHLQTLLLYLSHFKASEPRDKVFALLGLCKDTDGNLLHPDYKTSPQQIYHRVTRYLLLRDSCIDLLSKGGVSSLKSTKSLPSWVPDFEQSMTGLLGEYFHQSVEFEAAGHSKPIVKPGMSDDSIIVRGVKIGPILKLTDQCSPTSANWLNQVEALVEEVQRLPESQLNHLVQRNRSEGKCNWIGALWHALVTYRIPSQSINDRASFGRQFQIWREHILESKFYHDFNMAGVAVAEASIEGTKYKLPDRFSDELQSFDRMCKLVAHERRFFTTKSGFFGITCPEAKEDDDVVILLGAATPFIVRKSDSIADAFVLVGTAYVDGIMYGEAMGPNETTDFLLV